MARRCKCGCRAEIKPARQCDVYREKLGYASDECQEKAAIDALDKIRARNKRKMNADINKAEKTRRAKHGDDKERIKTRAKWLYELQLVFNQYVRLRDFESGCISCDKPKDWNGQWHASHYYSRGHSSALRFNLWNVHKSCSVCNSHLSGNIGEYTPRLIEKIGQERFDYLLSNKSRVKTFDIEWIKRAIKITKKGVKLKKR